MGLALNDHCRSALRPFLLAALATLAWLIWGAGTANAALPDPELVPQLAQASTSAVEEAPATVTPLVVSPVAALAELPAETVLPVTGPITGTATTVTNTVTSTVASTIPTVEAGLGAAVGVVSAGADAVLPVVTGTVEIVDSVGIVDTVEIVDAVVGIVPTVLETPLPGPDLAIPLPTPLPTIPGLLFPDQEGHNDGQGGEEPGGQLTAETGSADAGLPPSSQDPRTGRSLLVPPAFRSLAATGSSAETPPVPKAPDPGQRQLLTSLPAGPGSAFTGSAGGGAQAWADVAGFWAVPLTARGARMPALHQLPPAVPSFDPGSSPD
jgi:hypothetical protein